jgi:hypothetical protein
MVRQHLGGYFGLAVDSFSVHRHALEDFLVRFAKQRDRDLVHHHAPPHPPFTLIWQPWRRTSMASAGAFTFCVLVAMSNVPAHARCASVAGRVLGTSCAAVEIAPQEVVPEDDDRLFVTAWCIHLSLVPDEKILAIPEPRLLEVREDMPELPALRYLVRCQVVVYQDWSEPCHTTDEDEGGGDDDDDDSGDCGHHHPGLDTSRRTSWGAKSVGLASAGADGPALGNLCRATFRSRMAVLVGAFECPVIGYACCQLSGDGDTRQGC